MKEQIHTIPLNDAFSSGDECPFCFLARQAEQSAIRHVAGPGASYMEPEIREITNKSGFCQTHMKKLYDYGNPLGAALMLQTHFDDILRDIRAGAEEFIIPPKKPLLGRKKPTAPDDFSLTLAQRAQSCYICEKIEYNMQRYWRTFFALLKEPEFRERVLSSKGLCLSHFAQALDYARELLPNSQREWFYENLFPWMIGNLERVKEDLDWMISLYDYRNAGADPKNSRDALQRTMEKLTGGHPADKPYKAD